MVIYYYYCVIILSAAATTIISLSETALSLDCNSGTNCNGIQVRYPFGAQRFCGHPHFLLECTTSTSTSTTTTTTNNNNNNNSSNSSNSSNSNSSSNTEPNLLNPNPNPSLNPSSSAFPRWRFYDGASFRVRRIALGGNASGGTVILQPDDSMSTCGRHTPANFSNLMRNFYLLSSARSTFVRTTYVVLAYACSAVPSNASTGNGNGNGLPPGLILNGPLCSTFLSQCSNNNADNNNSNLSPPLQQCYQASTMAGNVTLTFRNSKCLYYTIYQSQDTVSVAESQYGIEVEWHIPPESASRCNQCHQKSNGTCGYNETVNFLCYCPDNRTSMNPFCSSILPADGMQQKTLTRRNVLAIILGGTLSTTMVALLITVAVYLVLKRRIKRKGTGKCSDEDGFSYGYNSGNSNDENNKRKVVQVLAEQVGPISTMLYSFQELVEATSAFEEARILGDGGYGAVYEGRLRDGRKVAVKRLYHDNYRRLEQFVNEIRLLSRLDHPHLIKLYGFCYEDPHDLLLVYEFASNGTLADHLYAKPRNRLSWETRFHLAFETALALEYLHFSLNPPIFHRDVKSTNILVDSDFHVKLADFGISRVVSAAVSHVSTAPQGTPGYLDPDYHQSYQLTDKSDVYSFGVVLMEIISGMQPVDFHRCRREINLSNLAITKIQSGALEELVDHTLGFDRNPLVRDMVTMVASLALQCLAADKDDRPNMRDVVQGLIKVKQMFSNKVSDESASLGSLSEGMRRTKGPEGGLCSPASEQSSGWSSTDGSPAFASHDRF